MNIYLNKPPIPKRLTPEHEAHDLAFESREAAAQSIDETAKSVADLMKFMGTQYGVETLEKMKKFRDELMRHIPVESTDPRLTLKRALLCTAVGQVIDVGMTPSGPRPAGIRMDNTGDPALMQNIVDRNAYFAEAQQLFTQLIVAQRDPEIKKFLVEFFATASRAHMKGDKGWLWPIDPANAWQNTKGFLKEGVGLPRALQEHCNGIAAVVVAADVIRTALPESKIYFPNPLLDATKGADLFIGFPSSDGKMKIALVVQIKADFSARASDFYVANGNDSFSPPEGSAHTIQLRKFNTQVALIRSGGTEFGTALTKLLEPAQFRGLYIIMNPRTQDPGSSQQWGDYNALTTEISPAMLEQLAAKLREVLGRKSSPAAPQRE